MEHSLTFAHQSPILHSWCPQILVRRLSYSGAIKNKRNAKILGGKHYRRRRANGITRITWLQSRKQANWISFMPSTWADIPETKSPFKPRGGREESVELLKATFSCKFGELQLTSQEQDRDCFLPRQRYEKSHLVPGKWNIPVRVVSWSKSNSVLNIKSLIKKYLRTENSQRLLTNKEIFPKGWESLLVIPWLPSL